MQLALEGWVQHIAESELILGLGLLSASIAFCRAKSYHKTRIYVRSANAPVHEILSVASNTRLLIVGDVHGCLEELIELEQKTKDSVGSNEILTILVGDLVNKGPFSAQVIRYVRERGWKCVMGNHDYAIAQAFGREGSVERKYGTNSEKNNWISQMSPEDKQWLCDLPYTIRIPDKGVIIVHAGFVPGISLQVQRQEDMILLRNIDLNSGPCSAEASVAKGVGEGSRKDCSGAWADEWSRQASILGRTSRLNNSFKCQYSNMKKEQELKVPVGPDHTRDMESADALLMNFHVVFGHDAKRGLQLTDHATGLDTGCCYGKKLTGLIWPERTLVQVPARRVYEVPGQRSAASASDTSEYASTNTSPVAPKALFSKSLAAKIASHNHAG